MISTSFIATSVFQSHKIPDQLKVSFLVKTSNGTIQQTNMIQHTCTLSLQNATVMTNKRHHNDTDGHTFLSRMKKQSLHKSFRWCHASFPTSFGFATCTITKPTRTGTIVSATNAFRHETAWFHQITHPGIFLVDSSSSIGRQLLDPTKENDENK